jgi:Cu(I)/Ag(I) efflux system membrane fusion protein
MTFATKIVAAVAASLVIAGVGYGAYRIGMQRGMQMAAPAPVPAKQALIDPSNWSVPEGEEATRRHQRDGLKAGDVDPLTGRRIAYYHDPMSPGKQFTAPGKSPFMDMMLVPMYADADTDAPDTGRVTISPRVAQNLGVRTAPVIEAPLAPRVTAVGAIAFNERDQAVLQARAQGFVEKVMVRATQDYVGKGQPLVELYFPDWVAAQEEFLSVRRMKGDDLTMLVDGARQRMRQVGMSEADIAAVEASGRTQPRTTLHAPIGGLVTEIAVREGMTVMPGATLFRINGLGTVWANAEVPETVAAFVRPGMQVVAHAPSLAGTALQGRVQSLLPEVNPQTRTIKARVELANPQGKLVPGMFVQIDLAATKTRPVLLVPSEAIIQTGMRTVVMVAEEGGRFRPVDVETGDEVDGQLEIRRGLSAGQRVVLSGQFLIDSEASLRGLSQRLNAETAPSRPMGTKGM